MKKVLENKTVLLFVPQFFGYEISIKQEIERQGAIVHMYDERPNPTSVEKILIRKARFLLKEKIKRYYDKVNEIEKNYNPDYILFINAETVDKEILDNMKHIHTKACFILYMWDSIKNKPVKRYFNIFDRIYSFDREDCKKYGLLFRPLFFIPVFEKKNEDTLSQAYKTEKRYKYDISFIGTVHSDRVKIVSKLLDYCNTQNFSYYWYLYVPGKLMYFLRWCTDKAFRRIDKQYIHIEPMSKEKFAEVSKDTRCVLDINHPKQTGLTMRTIEMVGACRKIITTNAEVEKYEFYIPSNQIVISRDMINIEKELIVKDYVNVEQNIYEKYTIRGWIGDLFKSE